MSGTKPNNFLNYSYSDFIDKELILFSMSMNKRSIPSVVDGLKPGHRKILYSCFRKNLDHEIKVGRAAIMLKKLPEFIWRLILPGAGELGCTTGRLCLREVMLSSRRDEFESDHYRVGAEFCRILE